MSLTSMQEKFCQGIVDGLGQSEAYKAAGYGENSSASTIYVNAYQLSNDNQIVSRLAELRAPAETALAARRVFTAESLADEAETNLRLARAAEQYGPANKALELMGRFSGNLDPQPGSIDVQIVKVTIVLPPSNEPEPVIVDVSEYKVSSDTEDGEKEA